MRLSLPPPMEIGVRVIISLLVVLDGLDFISVVLETIKEIGVGQL